MRKLTLMTATALMALTFGMSAPAMADDTQDVLNSTVVGTVNVGGTLFGGNSVDDDVEVEQTVVGNNIGVEAQNVSVSGTTDQLVFGSTVNGTVNVGGYALGGNVVDDDVEVDNTTVGNNLNVDAQGSLTSDQTVLNSTVESTTNVGGFFVGGNDVGDDIEVTQTTVANNFDYTFTGPGSATVDQDLIGSTASSTVNVGGFGVGGNLVGNDIEVTNTAVGNNANWDTDL